MNEEDGPDQTTGRSRFEDWEIPDPDRVARVSTGRTPTLVIAAVVLGAAGLIPLLALVAFDVSGTTALLLGAIGVFDLVACALVAMLRPLGRPIGIAAGTVGVLVGLVTAGNNGLNALLTIGLNGFVIYAVATSGGAFRRR
jgi:hypothetical protein